MKKIMFMFAAAAVTFTAAAADKCYQPPRVKLIHDGWGFQYESLKDGQTPSRKFVMNTRFIKENVELLEKSIPGSGIIIRFTTPAELCEGSPVNINAIFGGRKIKYEYFKNDIENLKNTRFTKFTDNFIGLTVSPGNVDWFDDEAWATVCHNHKVAAKVAKESGMVGMKFDIEEYHKNTMWQFKPEKGRTLAETHAKIRQRGQEFGRALFSEFPDMEMLCYWWFSLARHKNDAARCHADYYMVAPFINGIYDVLPPTVKIHDGDESCGYRANDEVEFYHLNVDVRKRFLPYLDKKHLAKYRAQTFLAPGLYVDPHFKKAGYWENQLQPDLDRLGGAALLKRNLFHAMEVADYYVWMWHERYVWFPCHHPAHPTHIASLAPGLAEELDLIASPDPLPEARKLVKEKNIPNIIRNSTFDQVPEKKQTLPGFSIWYDSINKGKFIRKVVNGNAVAASVGATEGCFFQDIPVKPGEMYLVRCSGGNISPKSKAQAAFSIKWKKSFPRNGKTFDDYFADYLGNTRYFRTADGRMETIEFTVIVPETASHMAVMLWVCNASGGEEIYFDDLEVFKIMDK